MGFFHLGKKKSSRAPLCDDKSGKSGRYNSDEADLLQLGDIVEAHTEATDETSGTSLLIDASPATQQNCHNNNNTGNIIKTKKRIKLPVDLSPLFNSRQKKLSIRNGNNITNKKLFLQFKKSVRPIRKDITSKRNCNVAALQDIDNNKYANESQLSQLFQSGEQAEAENEHVRINSTGTLVISEKEDQQLFQNITNCDYYINRKKKNIRMPTTKNPNMSDEDAVAAADKEMEERANRAKELLSQRYKGLKSAQEAKQIRKMQLERRMVGLPEDKKQNLRRVLEHEEMLIQKENRKKISTSDFESLTVIGRGAFGEVRLVRRKSKRDDPDSCEIFALKSMKKEMMVIKNQVGHVRAERDALAKASENNRWLTVLHCSFFDETHLYMVMEYLPGGDLMSLLIKEDTFSERVTMFIMAEAAQAISSVHALGYIHRDIKPDNMLLDARGHLKLTDLGLCKKVGEVSPAENPEVVLEILRGKGMVAQNGEDTRMHDSQQPRSTDPAMEAAGKHREADDIMAMSIDDGVDGARRAKTDGKTRREMAYSTVGTPDYIAPEVLAAQNGASGYSYTCAVDWWSLGVIMFECLVGYTPFYADDPVTTCRKILRWRQCLDMPAETKSQLSPDCIDFLSCLLAGPEARIGSSKDGDFENGFKEVVQHPWFRNFDWEGLRDREGPLLPSGSKEFPELLEYLKTCPKSDPRFQQLVQRVTQNFDTFEDFGSNLDRRGKVRVNRNALDQFYDYSYRRVRKPRVPLPEMFSS